MGRTRLELQELFETFCENVYFQPPEAHRMSYPCIRYRRSPTNAQHADNQPYALRRVYEVTVIDRDPEGTISRKLEELPGARHDRAYTAEGLNHDVFQLTS